MLSPQWAPGPCARASPPPSASRFSPSPPSPSTRRHARSGGSLERGERAGLPLGRPRPRGGAAVELAARPAAHPRGRAGCPPPRPRAAADLALEHTRRLARHLAELALRQVQAALDHAPEDPSAEDDRRLDVPQQVAGARVEVAPPPPAPGEPLVGAGQGLVPLGPGPRRVSERAPPSGSSGERAAERPGSRRPGRGARCAARRRGRAPRRRPPRGPRRGAAAAH
jgi:hypothetical protein